MAVTFERTEELLGHLGVNFPPIVSPPGKIYAFRDENKKEPSSEGGPWKQMELTGRTKGRSSL